MRDFVCSRDCTHDDRCDEWVRHQRESGEESALAALVALMEAYEWAIRTQTNSAVLAPALWVAARAAIAAARGRT